MRRDKEGAAKGCLEGDGGAEGSKNIVSCSKWAVTRSCVTTASIARKGGSTEKAADRQREKNSHDFLFEGARCKSMRVEISHRICRHRV